MSERLWTRREFSKLVAPALVAPALPAFAGQITATGLQPTDSGLAPGGRELWTQARATIAFYRKHLPEGLSLVGPTSSAPRRSGTSTRCVTFSVMNGDTQVGHLDLDAAFEPGQSAPLWQATRVAGAWYGASIANAFKSGQLA